MQDADHCSGESRKERQNKKNGYTSTSSKRRDLILSIFTRSLNHHAWLGRLLAMSDDKWKVIPNFYFGNYGGLLFLLKCNYDVKLLKTGE